MNIIIVQGDRVTSKVMLNGKLLNPVASQQVYNHSPDGFNWGYCGSGPAQLALAILLETLAIPAWAVKYHQEFKSSVISKLPMDKDFYLRLDLDEWLINNG